MSNTPSLPTKRRSVGQKILDAVTFPIRALTLFTEDGWGLSSLRTERFDYVARFVHGLCLDIGCGEHNLFIRNFLGGHGQGFDVFAYEGLAQNELVTNLDHFPCADSTFDTVTLIACLNHIPVSARARELGEAYRCLKAGGRIVVTMGVPWAETLIHRVIAWYDRLFGTHYDMDTARGMAPGETYSVPAPCIRAHLAMAGFRNVSIHRFWTQWGLNRLFIGWKPIATPDMP
ncbi:MAG: class I SAM-dependent methyltransferase [Deltaproteobacteria bacterium]|nr:class I SAM-dependent methyltransferase [Deltaproteobacteria bacterium]